MQKYTLTAINLLHIQYLQYAAVPVSATKTTSRKAGWAKAGWAKSKLTPSTTLQAGKFVYLPYEMHNGIFMFDAGGWTPINIQA